MKNLLMTAIAVFGIATTTLAQVPSYVPTNGLVGYWPFNANANDESGNGNNGTVNGATLTSDRFGSTNAAYSFNGVSNYIQCMQPGPIGVPSITVAFWTKNIGSGSGHIVSWGNNGISGEDFRVLTNAYGTCASSLDFDIYNSGIAFDNTFSSNSWDFYVVIFDSSIGTNINAASVYKNGVQIGLTCFNQNNSSINISSAFPICFGKYHGTIPTDYLSGIVDDIGIWSRVLTQQEITDLYTNSTLGISEVSQSNLFSVFPSPAQNLINVEADNKLIGEVYTIYDNRGRIVLTGKINSNNTIIELGNLSGGIYIFRVGENMKQTFKVIKE